MNFLYPSFFWALGVLAIPVIIHLFNFKRTTRVFFSNLRFLRKVKESTTAKRRLKHYLILLSRILFLTFLVITFCQPFIPASEDTVNHHNVVLYLDNSESMSVQGKDRRRSLDEGVAFIRSILEVMPADARYRLVTNDFAPFSNTFKSRKEVDELLTQLRISPVSRSMREVLGRIRQQGGIQNEEVFYISDFQKSTLGSLDKTIMTDSTLHLHLVPVTAEVNANIFVDSVFLDNPFAARGEKNALHVRLRNDGSQSVDQLAVKFTVNSVQAGTATMAIPAGGIAETSFDLTGDFGGLNRAQLQFTDFPVAFDNQFYFSLTFGNKIKVLEIKSASGPTPVERVFGNTGVFQYAGFNANNVNYSALLNADLVIVNGLNVIDGGLNSALQEYMSTGKTLMLIPGPKADLLSFQKILPQLQLTSAVDPVRAELDKPDFSNPFFENVFEEKTSTMLMPQSLPVLEWRRDANSILKFKNDRPFLSRVEVGGGIFVLASPLEKEFTDFYNNALFVPVMYRIAASSKRENNRLYHSLNENFVEIRLDSISPSAQLRLVRREEIIPEQRIIGDRVTLDIPKFTMNQGFYNVVTGSDTLNILAFNLDKRESLLTPVTVAEVKTSLGESNQVTIFKSGTADTFSNEIKERYLGTPLWKYFLILALVFVAVEILLIRFLK